MLSILLKIALLGIFNVIALQLAIALGTGVGAPLGIGIGVFVALTNLVFLRKSLYPWRWIMPAMAGIALLVLYPIGYSVSVAFTNYGDGHLLSRQQVINQRLAETFAAPDAPVYSIYIYRSDAQNAFRYWLDGDDGSAYAYTPGADAAEAVAPDDPRFSDRSENGVPLTYDGFARLAAGGALRFSQTLQNLVIPLPDGEVRITQLGLTEAQRAQQLERLWEYDDAAGTLTNLQAGAVYTEQTGNFVSGEGANRHVLEPGFPANIGLTNITRALSDPTIRGPFWSVFVWTMVFAAGSVFLTFSLGLAFGLLLNWEDMPFRPFFRSALIIPYAVPGWLLITTWRGLLNPVYGPVNLAIAGVIGISPQWFSDPMLAKIAVLFVNMYLGFPYMMLITLGTLQSIPQDMYEAAIIDGANARQRLQKITLPMLLVAMAPLLVASFSFNFNNFTMIELLTNGGPPMGPATLAGHTDILLSYTYRLAFGGAAGTNYGFAAAIGIFIFMIIAPITLLNFRLTKRFEEAVN